MIKADLALSDLVLDVTLQGSELVVGGSRLTPYAHPALETLLVRTERQWFVAVRERVAGGAVLPSPREVVVDADHFDLLYRECLTWPLDYVLVEVAQLGARLKIRAGALGSAPVYCHVDKTSVALSWDIADLLARTSVLDAEVACHALLLEPIYAARQLCTGITMLTERSTLHVEPGHVFYQYPRPSGPIVPSATAPNSLDEAGRAFGEMLWRVIAKRPLAPDRMVVQLSGGMDSAAVAVALSKSASPLASRGILLDGDCRRSQVERRQHIVARLGLFDETVEMAAYPPSLDLLPGGRRERPLREFYLEAFQALWAGAARRGDQLLFTGVGGDELFLPFRFEVDNTQAPTQAPTSRIYTDIRLRAQKLLSTRALNIIRSLRTFDAPQAPVPVSALLAQASHAPHLLQHGLWPVNPLCDPVLVGFCHRLPATFRHERAPLRHYLQASLGADVFRLGYAKETFARVLPELIAQQADTIAAQLKDCALADSGLVDGKEVLALLDEVRRTRAEAATAPLVNFLWLERFVRQLG
ncbi:hypothetical protein [Frateuria defendens]|uniref:hypothetical protein n=1 Tax=Frateuria defendens TaxID=2219559 RepID=UPI0009E64D0E|nr:hypothetical protein [Frateuria defendens]